MKITSTMLLDKPNLKRKRKYATKKKQPEVVLDSEIEKDLFDVDVLDLTDDDCLTNIIEEEDSQTTMSLKARKDMTKDITKDVLLKLEDLKRDVKKPKTIKTRITKGGESLCLLFSDWHYGKVIKTRSGKFIYNSDIAKDRIENQLVPQILENVSRIGSKKIDEVVVIFAGDIIDNDIVYDTQRLRIDKGVAVQFYEVTTSIVAFTHSLAKALDSVGRKDIKIRFECVIGNHGRPSAISKIGICSWDTAVYSALDLALRQSSLAKRTEVSFSLEDYKMINIRGHRGLIQHQAPPQSETPSSKKKFGGWYEIFDFDFMCYGDLHHPGLASYNGRPLLMNGSLCGYDEFAIKLGLRDPWSQWMWIATDEKPMTMYQQLS